MSCSSIDPHRCSHGMDTLIEFRKLILPPMTNQSRKEIMDTLIEICKLIPTTPTIVKEFTATTLKTKGISVTSKESSEEHLLKMSSIADPDEGTNGILYQWQMNELYKGGNMVLIDQAMTQSENSQMIGEKSRELIKHAEVVVKDNDEWRHLWSMPSVEDRIAAAIAVNEFVNTRPKRLNHYTGDVYTGICIFHKERCLQYLNFLNNYGHIKERRILPKTLKEASSDIDWDASIEAKLTFIIYPHPSMRSDIKL